MAVTENSGTRDGPPENGRAAVPNGSPRQHDVEGLLSRIALLEKSLQYQAPQQQPQYYHYPPPTPYPPPNGYPATGHHPFQYYQGPPAGAPGGGWALPPMFAEPRASFGGFSAQQVPGALNGTVYGTAPLSPIGGASIAATDRRIVGSQDVEVAPVRNGAPADAPQDEKSTIAQHAPNDKGTSAAEDKLTEQEQNPIPQTQGKQNQSPDAEATTAGSTTENPVSTLDAMLAIVDDPESEQVRRESEPGTAEAVSDPPVASKPSSATHSRIQYVRKTWNSGDAKWEEVVEDPAIDGATESQQPEASTKHVIFHRIMDVIDAKQLGSVEFVVQPKMRIFLAQEVHEWWVDSMEPDTLKKMGPYTLQTPFYPFAWRWSEYVAACAPKSNDTDNIKECREALREFLTLLRTSKDLEPFLRVRDSINATKKIRYEFLWTLFEHGCTVYAKSFMDQWQMFHVTGTSAPPLEDKNRFRVSCTAFDWDGTNFKVYTYDFKIKKYSRERAIESLPIIPSKYFGGNPGLGKESAIRRELLARGQKFYNLCLSPPSTSQCTYEGTAFVGSTNRYKTDTSSVEGGTYNDDDSTQEISVAAVKIAGSQNRVIIDNYAFLNSRWNETKPGDVPPLARRVPFSGSDCGICITCLKCPLMRWEAEVMDETDSKEANKAFGDEEDRLLYLPPRLLGFALGRKQWAQFLVDNIQMLAKDKERKKAFAEQLQLEESAKQILLALVQHHRSPTALGTSANNAANLKSFDVVEGKGQGLIVMLHGPPGVGK